MCSRIDASHAKSYSPTLLFSLSFAAFTCASASVAREDSGLPHRSDWSRSLARSRASVADLRHTRHSRLNSSVTSPLRLKRVIGPSGTLPRHRPYVIPPSIIIDHPPSPTHFNTIGPASSPAARHALFSRGGPPASVSYFLIRYVALTVPRVSVRPFWFRLLLRRLGGIHSLFSILGSASLASRSLPLYKHTSESPFFLFSLLCLREPSESSAPLYLAHLRVFSILCLYWLSSYVYKLACTVRSRRIQTSPPLTTQSLKSLIAIAQLANLRVHP